MAGTETRAPIQALVVAPQWIGDAVMTEPLLRRLHARGERLTVGALPWVAPVYRAMPQVAEVVEFPFAHGGLQWRARRQVARQFTQRERPFDVAYVLPNSIKSALLPFLAGIPRRVGYLGESRIGLLTHRLRNPRGERPPMVAFYSALSGDTDLGQDRPALRVPAAATQPVLRSHGLEAGSYVVLAPGAEFGPAKRWPVAHFAELAQSLIAQQGCSVVLLGSAKESALCRDIAAGQPAVAHGQPGCLDLSGRTSLDVAMALIAAAGGVVSNDSGLMHVAAAFGVPQVAVFGSSSPEHTPPLNPHAQVIWLRRDAQYQPALDCAPCFERECPKGHTRCLNDVSAARVGAALQQARAV